MTTPRTLLASILGLSLAPLARAQDPEVEIDIEDPAPATPEAPTAPQPPPPAASTVDDAARARIAELEARLAALEARPTPPEPTPAPAAPPPAPGWEHGMELRFSGYVQSQYEIHQLSEDEVDADGGLLNEDRFLLRRGRLAAVAAWKYAKAALEIDLNTVHGPFAFVKTGEITGMIPGKDDGDLPYAALSLGLGDVPFGFELRQSSRVRTFMERTQGSRALFPSDNDVGARLEGAAGPIVYAVAAQNGAPLANDPDVESLDPIAQKTVLGRVGADTGASEKLRLTGGVSALTGAGLHRGNAGTKDALAWKDANQDGLVTLNELTATPGQAAQPSLPFDRWAVGGDVELRFHTPLGWTTLQAEGIVASNLDRGYYVADPVSTGFDLRESSWTVAAVQDVTKWGLVAFRADSYQPNADLFESERGRFVPVEAGVLTLSPVVGVQVHPLAKLLLQWDYIVDHLGRDTLGQPIDLPNDVWTVRGQVEF